jgi:glutamyl-tRNA synthetase
MRRADDARLTRLTLERLARRAEGAVGAVTAERVARLMPAMKERAQTLEELADQASFLTRTIPLAFEPKAEALLTPEARIALRGLARAFDGIAWEAAALEAATRAHAEATGAKLKDLAMPLRAALTGSTVSPPVFDVAAALGEAETRARIAAVSG